MDAGVGARPIGDPPARPHAGAPAAPGVRSGPPRRPAHPPGPRRAPARCGRRGPRGSRRRGPGGRSASWSSFSFGRITVADAGAVGGEHLLLHAADREHLAGERDLPGHGDVLAHRAPGEGRDQRGRHRHAGRGAVLGHGAGGHVQVDVVGGEEVVGQVEAELRRRGPARTRGPPAPTPSSRRRAGRSRSGARCPAWPCASTNRISPPGAGHREAGGHPRLARAALDLVVDALGAQDLPDHRRRPRPRGRRRPRPPAARCAGAIAPRRRSSWRTPASRVYSPITVRRPSSVTSSVPSGSPAAAIWRGSR